MPSGKVAHIANTHWTLCPIIKRTGIDSNAKYISLSSRVQESYRLLAMKIIALKAVDEGAMVRYGCNGTREVSFSILGLNFLSFFTQPQVPFHIHFPSTSFLFSLGLSAGTTQFSPSLFPSFTHFLAGPSPFSFSLSALQR